MVLNAGIDLLCWSLLLYWLAVACSYFIKIANYVVNITVYTYPTAFIAIK